MSTQNIRWNKAPLALLALALPLLASAAEPQQPVGAQTRAWLQAQQEQPNDTRKTPPVPGEVAQQVYKRYVDSFAHPLPESFSSESASSSGSSGSGSGSGGQ